MASHLQKRLADALRDLSRVLPIKERTRARIRARLLPRLTWLLPRRQQPGYAHSTILPGQPAEGSADYYIWALLDWHFRLQRPQQFARKLAESGRRVFFISSTLVDSRKPGFRVEPLDHSGRIFQIFLQVRGAPSVYFGIPTTSAVRQLEAGLEQLLDWSRPSNPISLVEHPFWGVTARSLPDSRLVYDRMDYHPGFGTFDDDLVSAERDLMAGADLTVVSSHWLDRDTARYTSRRILIRNAADYEHFSERPDAVFSDERGRRVIGYFGAIAGWMDLDLVAAVAQRYPECLVILIGHDQIGAARRIASLSNVRLLGEVPYSNLPFYLHGFDVCLLPRRISPLTEAMNPVKLYEYLSAGRPVVAVNLPELDQFDDLVYTASTKPAFLDAVRVALGESPEDPIAQRRRAFASRQTWSERASRLAAAAETLPRPGPLRGQPL